MDIGSVIYKKDFVTGDLTAVWNHAVDGTIVNGTGKARGEAGNTYVGRYSVAYFLSDHSDAGIFDLEISKEQNAIKLDWYKNGELLYTGIGQINGDRLIAGWRKI